VSKPTLDGVWAKIRWARKHTERLEALADFFLKRRPNQVSFDDHSEPPWLIIRAVVEPMPIEFSLIAGDAVNNLRAALDHLAWQLVIASGGTPGRHTAFPLSDTEAEFERRVRNPPKNRTSPLEGIDPTGDIWALVERFQPYEPASDPIGILPAFSNRDKHQGLLAGISFSEEMSLDELFTVDGGAVFEVKQTFEPPALLAHNAEIARINASGAQVRMKADPPVSVSLSDGERASSVGALDRLRSKIVQIVRDAEDLL
jgi:hypothetical protein